MAPITYPVSCSAIGSGPSPARLMRCRGASRRRLIWMMRSVPPAMKRAASPWSRAKAMAASIVSGRWKEKPIERSLRSPFDARPDILAERHQRLLGRRAFAGERHDQEAIDARLLERGHVRRDLLGGAGERKSV